MAQEINFVFRFTIRFFGKITLEQTFSAETLEEAQDMADKWEPEFDQSDFPEYSDIFEVIAVEFVKEEKFIDPNQLTLPYGSEIQTAKAIRASR